MDSINIKLCLQYACKNQKNRNKMDNKAKSDNKNIDFMPFIKNNINGHIEFEWWTHTEDLPSHEGRSFDVCPPPGFPKRWTEGEAIGRNLRRFSARMGVLRQDCSWNKHNVCSWVGAVYGVSGVRCSSSARTVQEASDSEADWKQSTAN